jgi:flagellar basal-body rod modification protein FlgD
MEIGTTNVLASDFGARRAEPGNDRSQLGQEDFLQLIVAQVQNQDPFEPTDNGAFIADLASFSSLDSINNLSDSFQAFSNSFNSSQVLNAASLIGQTVTTPGNEFLLEEGQPAEAFVNANGQVGNATVQISNSFGEVVASVNVPLVNPGLNSFSFDGLDESGHPLPAGNYFLSASIPDGESDIRLFTEVNTKIDSVNLGGPDSGSVELGLATGNTTLLDNVTRISQ